MLQKFRKSALVINIPVEDFAIHAELVAQNRHVVLPHNILSFKLRVYYVVYWRKLNGNWQLFY